MIRSPAALATALAALALLAAGCGDSGSDGSQSTSTVTVTDSTSTSTTDTDETTVGQTTEETTATEEGSDGADGADGSPPPADIHVTSLTGFTSPTGNIGCYIDRESVRCDIRDRDWDPGPAPADCNQNYGQGIELPAGGAPDFVCAGDTALDGGDPLPYGQSIAAGLLRCESAETGMTCTDTETGRGFTLAKEAYDFR